MWFVDKSPRSRKPIQVLIHIQLNCPASEFNTLILWQNVYLHFSSVISYQSFRNLWMFSKLQIVSLNRPNKVSKVFLVKAYTIYPDNDNWMSIFQVPKGGWPFRGAAAFHRPAAFVYRKNWEKKKIKLMFLQYSPS